jgi:hypothetical protein
MREFSFYLEAWKFCHFNNIPVNRIKRKEWDIWMVDVGSIKVKNLPAVAA